MDSQVNFNSTIEGSVHGFNFSDHTFENWGRLVAVREHDVASERAFPTFFGFRKLIISIFIILLLFREALLVSFLGMLAFNVLACINHSFGLLESLRALATGNISLGSCLFLDGSSVADDTSLSFRIVDSLSHYFLS